MGTSPTKAADNIYCRCRKTAARYNDKLNSREGASELLGCSPSTLADYELGITKIVPVDSVVRMADLYNAPEILNDYCTNECPIGKRTVAKLEIDGHLERRALKVIAALKNVDYIRDTLISIAADGVISEDEREDFDRLVEALDDISCKAQELKLWAEKMLGG